MKNCLRFLVLLILATVGEAKAQERLYPLTINPQLRQFDPARHRQHKAYYAEGSLLYSSDTLPLPFLDEFNRNTLRPYRFESNAITDSIVYSFGPCDSVSGVPTLAGRFHLQPSYTFFYDTINKKIDSTPKSPITFHYYAGTGPDCFDGGFTTLVVYPEYSRYTFDTIHGTILTDTLVSGDFNPDTVLMYSRILYRARIPADAKWVDNYAWVNRTYPLLPPTLGVATLDGLNQYGLPYNNSSPINYGVADYLTSKPIDMSGLSAADSVYLSFFYEPQGWGDWPNKKDSLVLEFFNGYTDKWDWIWSVRGDTVAPGGYNSMFQQVMVPVPASIIPLRNYFYKGFQFRFKNYASLAGNNDHWHIDYVRLAANRNAFDTVVQDLAFSYDLPSILKNYTMMPAWQFTGVGDIIDTVSTVIANVNYPQADGTNPPSVTWTASSEQRYPSPATMFGQVNTILGTRFQKIELFPSASYATPSLDQDSVVLFSKVYFGTTDGQPQNDTVSHTDVMTNTLAYDDGSAEMAYGLEGLYTKKVGLEFLLHQPDTLVGYQIHFANIDVKVDDLVFTYNLWDSLRMNDPAFVDSAIYTSLNRKPYYIDSVNGWATYRIDPFPVPSKFYFGWSQTDTRNLQVGYDINSKRAAKHLFVFTNGVWRPSTIVTKGSPMIRLLFRHSNLFTSGVAEISKPSITIYPNPVSGVVHVAVQDEHAYQLQLFNIMGQRVFDAPLENKAADLSALSEGVYLVHLIDLQTGLSYQNKLLKRP
ncbi:MAG: T9SS type A sorting domain-containing protein [Chitinophagales bacterium]